MPTGFASDGEVEDYVVTGLGNGHQNLIPAGSLDPGFGDGGFISSEIRQPTSDTSGYVVAYPSNGQLLVLGDTSSDVTVMRLNADGGVDGAFDTLGVAKHRMWSEDARMTASTMALDDQGRIIIAGTWSYIDGSGRDFVVTRLTPNGAIDTSFAYDDIAVARFLESGHLDQGFGNAGIQTTNLVDASRNSSDFVPELAIDGFGRIAITGYFYDHSARDNDLFVLWLNPDGSLDVSFDDDGKLRFDFGKDYDRMESIVVDSFDPVFGTSLLLDDANLTV